MSAQPPVPYAGVATRAAALVVDVAAAQLILFTTAAMLGIVASLVGELRPTWLVAALLAVGWAVVVGGYFLLFWTTTGQTPGMRLMHLRVASTHGGTPAFGRAVLRMVGLIVAIIPCFLGFVPVLFDARRRGLPDYLGSTVVLYDDAAVPPAEAVTTVLPATPSPTPASEP